MTGIDISILVVYLLIKRNFSVYLSLPESIDEWTYKEALLLTKKKSKSIISTSTLFIDAYKHINGLQNLGIAGTDLISLLSKILIIFGLEPPEPSRLSMGFPEGYGIIISGVHAFAFFHKDPL